MDLVRSVCVLLISTGFLAAEPPQALNQVKDTRFNYKRGFYSSGITVLISSNTDGARIRYTLDGSAPTPTHGGGDRNPLTVDIDRTTTLRVIAYKEGMLSSNVDTQTYLFLKDVLEQPARVPGYPNPKLPSGIREMVTLEYEMDPRVVRDRHDRFAMRRGLESIPTLSIVMDKDDLFRRVTLPGSDRTDVLGSGIYWGGSMEGGRFGSREGSTRPASVELLYPHRPAKNTQVDAAIEGHSWRLVKRAFRLVFKKEYGTGKFESSIFQDAPLNGETAAGVYDRIVLRSGKNRSWATSWYPNRTAYTRDQWARDTQIAMSGLGSHGTFVHLYLNGLYWGVYNACERPDAWFLAAHLGGSMQDWFAVNEDGPFHGDPARWNYLRRELKDKNMREPSHYEELQRYLDIAKFADYMILCWYMHDWDWPDYNWFAGSRINPPSPIMFFVWDAELSWETGPDAEAWVHPRFRADQDSDEANMVGIWHSLRKNSDFMILFADRVYRHCFNEGALTQVNVTERWRFLNRFVEDALLAESARWGDAREEVGATRRTRENTFYERVAERMRRNVEKLIEALREEGYYPALDPPELKVSTALTGGKVVELGNPNRRNRPNRPNRDNGTIYYTLTGEDPRSPGGDLSPNAFRGAAGKKITLGLSATLKARVKTNGPEGEWSALAEAMPGFLATVRANPSFLSGPPQLHRSAIASHPLRH